ncbi:AAA+ superfamily ATPase, partial [human gut metagenome]
MRRKVYDQLKKWKEEQNGESAVLINGARRVGKSYIVKEFAQKEYKSYILLDFNKIGKDIKSLFETYLDDLDTFFMYLSSFTNTPLYPRNSVIIFDEVQLYVSVGRGAHEGRRAYVRLPRRGAQDHLLLRKGPAADGRERAAT